MDQSFWRAVERELWPSLHGAGFTEGMRDRVWREKPDRFEVIQIIPIRLGGLYPNLRTAKGCAIEAGIELRAVSSLGRPGAEQKPPNTPACQIRARLDRVDPQRLRMADIWYVESDRSNLSWVVAEMQRLLLSEGLDWFEAFSSPHEILRLLRYENTEGVVMGSGGVGSAVRNHAAGFLALSLGEYEQAVECLSRAQEQWDDAPSIHGTVTDALDWLRTRKNGTEPPPFGNKRFGRGWTDTQPARQGSASTVSAEALPEAERVEMDNRHLIEDLGFKEYSTEMSVSRFADYIRRAGEPLGGDLAAPKGQALVQRIKAADQEEDEGANFLFHVDSGDGPQPMYFSYRWEDEGLIAVYFFSPPAINAILWQLGESRRGGMSAKNRARFRELLEKHPKKLPNRE